jgi:phage terminase small subunit
MAKPPTDPTATPTALSKNSQTWSKTMARQHDIVEGHRLSLLHLAARCLDTMEEARKQIARGGLTVPSQQGIKSHPAVAVERDARAAFARLIKQLKLDKEVKRPVGRPAHGLGVSFTQIENMRRNGNYET